ncbi:MAG: hypothetical protein EGP89_02795 [Ruminococcaceae bacterium]|nr:hypothetical protein [Oscillospiraceae bacterium]
MPDGSPVKVPFRHDAKSNGIRAHRAVRFLRTSHRARENLFFFYLHCVHFCVKTDLFCEKSKIFQKILYKFMKI